MKTLRNQYSSDPKVVIRVENLSKQYRLGSINHGTLARDLQSWWARLRGKEDPNLRLDQTVMPSKMAGADRFWALRDLSFDVKQGEVLGIIGGNGAGKSTLLKILSRVTTPTTGEVKISGRIASLLEVGTGFHPELTGRENVFLNGSILGMSRQEISTKFDEIVSFAEVEKFIDTPVKRYSSGMYVRLAFAVAAHLEPEILIVDEVLAVGDAQFQMKCLGKLEEVGRSGRAVLFVSHNMTAIKQLCQKVILIQSGRIADMGTPEEVVQQYLVNSGHSEAAEDVDIQGILTRLPEDPHIELLDVTFPEINLNSRILESGMSVKITVKFRIKKSASNLRLFFDLLNEYESLIFRSFHDCDYDRPMTLEPGEYSTTAVIPANFLAPLKYYLRIGATIFGSHSCTGNHLVVPLKIQHGGRVNRAYNYEVYLGEIAPLIEWKTTRN